MHKFNPKNLEKLDNPRRRQSMPPKETLQKFHIEGNGLLLDVGCGIGYFSVAAAELLKEGNVMGIDILDEILRVAKEKSIGISNLEYRKSEEYAFPVESKSVDYVWICNVIHEVENKEKYFQEIIRVLKPTGVLCVIEWKKENMLMGPPVEERLSTEELEQLARVSGFTQIQEIDINSEHYGLKISL